MTEDLTLKMERRISSDLVICGREKMSNIPEKNHLSKHKVLVTSSVTGRNLTQLVKLVLFFDLFVIQCKELEESRCIKSCYLNS